MVIPRWGVVLNPSPTNLVAKLILTLKEEPPSKRFHVLQGNFLHTGVFQELGGSLLTPYLSSFYVHGKETSTMRVCTCNLREPVPPLIPQCLEKTFEYWAKLGSM